MTQAQWAQESRAAYEAGMHLTGTHADKGPQDTTEPGLVATLDNGSEPVTNGTDAWAGITAS